MAKRKTQSEKHIHKYHNIDRIWHCALPDCTHFMPKNVAKNILGKYSLCWYCGKPFILDHDALKMEKPECFTCVTKIPTVAVDELIEEKTPTAIRVMKDLEAFAKHKGV